MNTDLLGLVESNYLDVAIMILVICSGFLVKKFWTQGRLDTAWRTLILSAALVVVYTIIMITTHELHETYWAKCFVSYTAATSLYELIIKKIQKYGK